jgi:hypothetical protein
MEIGLAEWRGQSISNKVSGRQPGEALVAIGGLTEATYRGQPQNKLSQRNVVGDSVAARAGLGLADGDDEDF